MTTLDDDYPCLGVCMIDADGYCTGCGRPPPSDPVEMQVDEAAVRDPQPLAEPESANLAG